MQEAIGISSGGTATLAAAARFPVNGLILAEASVANSAGRLEIGPLGSLTVQPGFGTLLGTVRVGEGDLDDLNAVRNNFGASAAVPEPASGALAAVLGCVGMVGRGRRRK